MNITFYEKKIIYDALPSFFFVSSKSTHTFEAVIARVFVNFN